MRSSDFITPICTILFALALTTGAQDHDNTLPPTTGESANALAEQMRGISMQVPGCHEISTSATCLRDHIYERLRNLGTNSVLPLSSALNDPDVQMRRNAALVLIGLNAPWIDEPRVDTRSALPALINAMSDADSSVRAWAAHAIGPMGPSGAPAVPTLIHLLSDPDEGPRNTSAIALREIGAPAISALPALRGNLNDPNVDPRKFAQMAITAIEEAVLKEHTETFRTQQGGNQPFTTASPPPTGNSLSWQNNWKKGS